MSYETSHGSAEASDDGGRGAGGAGEQSPLQARAAFFENWSWESVASVNQRLCARGGAQFGYNSESAEAAGRRWEATRAEVTSLGEALDALRSYHRAAPFLFFNGNTFADIARALAGLLFQELPGPRLRQTTSVVAHYVAGVLDRDATVALVEALSRTPTFEVGDRVRTIKGSLRGKVIAVLDGGRTRWRADSGVVFVGTVDLLLRDD